MLHAIENVIPKIHFSIWRYIFQIEMEYGIKNKFILIISKVLNNKSNLCIREKYCLIIKSKMLTPMFDSLSAVKRAASVLLSSQANSCTMLVVLRLVVAWAMS